jgi:uncharacterized protein (DUF1697 family)
VAQYVALLRGINVGGNKMVPMAELRELLTGLGYENVATLLQSGNAVFDGSGAATAVQSDIETAIADHFGFDVDVVVRTMKQIDGVLKHDPFAGTADDDSRYVVAFLSGKPDAAAAKELQAQDFAPELLEIKDTELYAWCPNKINDSPLLKAAGKAKLADYMTVRNWRTIRKIAALAAKTS